MRIDKYLKNARIIKRRTVAKEACEQGRIQLNGKIAKPGSEIKTGDIVVIQFGNKILSIRITQLFESPRKEDAADMYEVL